MSSPIQALPAALATPIDATQTSFNIRGLKDSNGDLITAMVGTLMHATIEPRSTTRQEIVSWTGLTYLGNGLCTVTGVTRNRNPQSPFTGQTGTITHAAGVEIILTDTSSLWNEYANVGENKTITGQWGFNTRPRSTGADTDPTALVTKAELAAASITPGALGTITVSGTAGESITIQNVVWNDPANGKWKVANGNVLAELEGTKMGISLGNAVLDAAITPGVALQGRVGGFSGLSIGAVYVSDTGTVSNTPGTNTRQIGIAVSATDILFDPDYKLLPTQLQKDAFAGGGDFGTPSSSNKFITEAYVTAKKINKTSFTASGTWTKGTGLHFIMVRMWGGGAAGGSFPEPAGANSTNAGGASGGEYAEKMFMASELGATETVTVGTGGIAGGAGPGSSSFGSLLTAAAGNGPGSNTNSPPVNQAGAYGGDSAGIGFPNAGISPTTGPTTTMLNGINSGAGGSVISGSPSSGGNSLYGGAGAGATASSGTALGNPGVSKYGGNAGAASGTSNVPGSPGQIPGGAGGNWMGNTGFVTALGGNGGRGQVDVYEFYF